MPRRGIGISDISQNSEIELPQKNSKSAKREAEE